MTYTICYQLGATGSEHRSPRAAARALASARRAAREGGDCQAIWAEDESGIRYDLDRVAGCEPELVATEAR
jgi:hypothetical protein